MINGLSSWKRTTARPLSDGLQGKVPGAMTFELPAHQAANRFCIGVAAVVRWVQRLHDHSKNERVLVFQSALLAAEGPRGVPPDPSAPLGHFQSVPCALRDALALELRDGYKNAKHDITE